MIQKNPKTTNPTEKPKLMKTSEFPTKKTLGFNNHIQVVKVLILKMFDSFAAPLPSDVLAFHLIYFQKDESC